MHTHTHTEGSRNEKQYLLDASLTIQSQKKKRVFLCSFVDGWIGELEEKT